MSEAWLVIAALVLATLSVRLSGVALGQRLPSEGPWSRALNALPGCLIVSLVSVVLIGGGPREWTAAVIAAAVAIATRNLPLTMAAGILAIWLLRQLT